MITLADCFATVRAYTGIGGRTRYGATCTACGVSCNGWTERQARQEFEEHRAIPIAGTATDCSTLALAAPNTLNYRRFR